MLRISIGITLLAIVLMSSCTSYKTVFHQEDPVVAGERIQVHLKTGEVQTFTVIIATLDSLKGESIAVARADITEIKKKKISAERSILAGVGIYVVSSAVALFGLLLVIAAGN